MDRLCIIGLDKPEYTELRGMIDVPTIAHEQLPRIVLQNGELFVEPHRGPDWLKVSKVVFHSMYEDDLEFISALALWGGPCLPNANAMMDCRLRLPCLVRALRWTRFGLPLRDYVSPHARYVSHSEHVAKWGNWHCGENKARFTGVWDSKIPCLVEPFLPGQAVRIVMIGGRYWQIRLEGNDWLKSIHDPSAALMPVDEELLEDTRRIKQGLGLEVLGNDYIVTPHGKHLLEVNHIPNVTRFPEIWAAYRDYVVTWTETLNNNPTILTTT